MKTFTLLLLVVFAAQCNPLRTESSKQNPQQANLPTADSETKRCDFSIYNPLVLKGTLGSPAVSMPQPQYPPEAKDRKLAGPVTVKVLINVRTGLVERACAIDGDEPLSKAAETAALKVRLSPYNDYIKERYQYAEGVVTYNFVAQ
jgi:hypothetical protein